MSRLFLRQKWFRTNHSVFRPSFDLKTFDEILWCSIQLDICISSCVTCKSFPILGYCIILISLHLFITCPLFGLVFLHSFGKSADVTLNHDRQIYSLQFQNVLNKNENELYKYSRHLPYWLLQQLPERHQIVAMQVQAVQQTGRLKIEVNTQVVIFLSDDQFCIFFSKLVRDIDLILFLS